MFGLPKEFICDNASIINSEFLKDLFAMTGVDQHSSVAYRRQSKGRAERAVQSIVNSLKQYHEQRGGSSKHSWVQRFLFGRDPVCCRECLPVSRMGLRMQDNFLVACWTNVLKSENALKTSIARSLSNIRPNIRSNRSGGGTVYGYVIVL